MKLSYNAFLKVIISIASKYNCSFFVFFIFNLSAWGNIFFISSFQSINQIMPLLYLNSNSFLQNKEQTLNVQAPLEYKFQTFSQPHFQENYTVSHKPIPPGKRKMYTYTHTHHIIS